MDDRRDSSDAVPTGPESERGPMSVERRNRLLLGIAVIAVVFAVIAVLIVLPSGPRVAQAAPSVGDPAPDFTVADINGGTFQLSAQRGHPVLLDFMGSNCVTCAAEMPDLRSVYSTYLSQGLIMISIDIGGSLGTKDPTEARNFMSAYGGTWPIALDNSNIGLTYGVITLPTLYVIDLDGRVAFRNAGPTSAADLSGAISRFV